MDIMNKLYQPKIVFSFQDENKLVLEMKRKQAFF